MCSQEFQATQSHVDNWADAKMKNNFRVAQIIFHHTTHDNNLRYYSIFGGPSPVSKSRKLLTRRESLTKVNSKVQKTYLVYVYT